MSARALINVPKTAKRGQVIEIKALALQKASDACQKQFNQAFLRILIARLTTANDRLSTRG